MPQYWACFESRTIGDEKYLFRFDTRIYLQDVDECKDTDPIIGAVVGKNPGSARPVDSESNSLQPIKLGRDQMLPTVERVLQKAMLNSGFTIPHRAFVQVLNLFYICNQKLAKAKKLLRKLDYTVTCPAERRTFPWLWYAWGRPKEDFGSSYETLTGRFRHIRAERRFFLDQQPKSTNSDKDKLLTRSPNAVDCAKHTQGMRVDLVIGHIRELLSIA